jgi:hypothetical protein
LIEPVVRAVLDASAMLSYAREHIHVGELLLEFGDEGTAAAVPAVTLLEAHARVGDDELATLRLKMLGQLPTITLLDLGRREAQLVSHVVPLVKGDLSRAHAVWAALRYRAYFVTAEPTAIPSIIDRSNVVVIPHHDA